MRRQTTGFTLIEVLIALVILAIALMASIKATEANLRDLSYLRDKMTAHWVADNVLANLQAGLLKMSPNRQQGELQMLRRTWYWQATPAPKTSLAVQRINIEVKATATGRPLANLNGFVATS